MKRILGLDEHHLSGETDPEQSVSLPAFIQLEPQFPFIF